MEGARRELCVFVSLWQRIGVSKAHPASSVGSSGQAHSAPSAFNSINPPLVPVVLPSMPVSARKVE